MFNIYQIQCPVKNLKEAVKDYSDLGFEVEWGGEPDYAHNACVKFKEGPMVELFTMPGVAYYLSYVLGFFYGQGARKRWQKWCRNTEQMCDFNLKASYSDHRNYRDFSNIQIFLNKIGIELCPMIKGSRKDLDGNILKYKYYMPKNKSLPFITSDYQIEVKGNIDNFHNNGATEISKVVLGVCEEDKAAIKQLLSDDERVEIVESCTTQVLGVRISGLKRKIDASKLHGLVIL